jgi:hypothetical protein
MNNETSETERTPPPVPPLKSRGRLLRFFSNPAVGVVGAIASILGVLLAVYVYQESKEYPQFTYYVHPVKASVLKPGQASKLGCNFEGQSITSDITVAQIAVWNQGKRSIKRDNILKPIVLYTTNGAPILEATVRKQSRDVVHLELDRTEIQKGRVLVSWNIAEQNDGGVIQVIYLGGSEVPIGLEGVIEGQRTLEKVDYGEIIKSPEEQFRSRTLGDRIFRVFTIIGGATLLLLGAMLRRASKRDRFGAMLSLVTIVIGILVIVGFGVLGILTHPVGPPFGFD